MSLILSENYIKSNAPVDARAVIDQKASLYEPNNWRIEELDDTTGRPTGKYILISYHGLTVWCEKEEQYYVFLGDCSSESQAMKNINNDDYDWTAFFGSSNWKELRNNSVNPGDITLEGYATEDWVKEQGYVTASYLDGILTLSGEKGEIGTLPEDTTINELLDAKADNVPFTLSQAYVTRPIGGYADMDDIAGKTVKAILTKLLGIVEKITAPTITVGSGGMSMTIKNSNNFPVTVQIISNSWEGKVLQTGSMYENHMGSYNFGGSVFTLDANSSITKTNGWDSANGILEITSYSLSCYFEAYDLRSTTESKNKL